MSVYVAKPYVGHFDILSPKDEYLATVTHHLQAASLVERLNAHSTEEHTCGQLSVDEDVVNIYYRQGIGRAFVAEVETFQEAYRLLEHLNRNNRPQGA